MTPTPKDKAIELRDWFLDHAKSENPPKPNGNFHAKQCAYYLTEQIQMELHDAGVYPESPQREYWYNVQIEIDNL